MANKALATPSASLSQLRRNPMATVATGQGLPVAIFEHKRLLFYCVPAQTYDALMEHLDDLELNAIARERQGEKSIRVSLDDL